MTPRSTGRSPEKKTPAKVVIDPAGGVPSTKKTRTRKAASRPAGAPSVASAAGSLAHVPTTPAAEAPLTPSQAAKVVMADEQDPTSLPLFATPTSARRLAGPLGGRAAEPAETTTEATTDATTGGTAAADPAETAPQADAGDTAGAAGGPVMSTSPTGIPGLVAPNATPGAAFATPPRGVEPEICDHFSSTPAAPSAAPVPSVALPVDYTVHVETPVLGGGPLASGAPAMDEAAVGMLDGGESIDWALVRRVRSEVAESLSDHLDGARLVDPETQGPAVERVVRDKLTELERESRIAGHALFRDRDELRRVAQAVFDDLFGRGRLLRLTTLPGLENLEIRGCDDVTLLFADGRIVKAAPVADSDEELIEELQYIASTAPTGEKAFSPAEPRLHMMLPDGSRLSAAAWYTSRPTATIRIHRYVDVTLADMVELNMLSREAADFLSASVRAGKSIVVSGMPGAGKTTLIRAILNELDPDVAIATIESMFELLMHEMPERHRRVWAAEATEGAGERLPNGRRIGQVTMADALRDALRQNVDRMVVGEVLGPEVRAMIDAMKVGKGSVSTIHATSAPDTVERLVSALMDPENGLVSVDHAYREVATHIDLIVYVDVIDETEIGGRKNRFVAQIYGIERSGDARYSATRLWDRGPDRRAAAQGVSPTWIDDLLPYGITDQTMRGAPTDTWKAPLKTIRDYRRGGRTS